MPFCLSGDKFRPSIGELLRLFLQSVPVPSPVQGLCPQGALSLVFFPRKCYNNTNKRQHFFRGDTMKRKLICLLLLLLTLTPAAQAAPAVPKAATGEDGIRELYVDDRSL